MDSLITTIDESNIESWLEESRCKYTFNDICAKFNIDLENDEKIKTVCHIVVTNRVVIDEPLLEYIGYNSGTYNEKKILFSKVLTNKSYVIYIEVPDEDGAIDMIMNSYDFELVLLQEPSPPRLEFYRLLSMMKLLFIKYCAYETHYERLRTQNLNDKHNEILNAVNAMKDQLVLEFQAAKIERNNNAQERIRNECERNMAQIERQSAEIERIRAEQARQCLEMELLETSIEREQAKAHRKKYAKDRRQERKRKRRCNDKTTKRRKETIGAMSVPKQKTHYLGKLFFFLQNFVHMDVCFCFVVD